MTQSASDIRRNAEFIRGLKDEAPLLVGVMPFGLIFGVLGIESGLTPFQVMTMSVIIFGGASQIIF
ncbi:MAG: AzlC family ABC transporter permease, partial [Candidatus Puniceispirillales bacterium]